MARLREGRANTARGAAHFLRETLGRVRYGGAKGQLTVRGRQRLLHPFHRRRLPQEGVRFSITVRQHQSLRTLIEAIPEGDWTPIPYWMEGAADVAETSYTPFKSEPRRRAGTPHRPKGETHSRLPTGAVRQLQLSRLHHRPGRETPWNWRLTTAATPR